MLFGGGKGVALGNIDTGVKNKHMTWHDEKGNIGLAY